MIHVPSINPYVIFGPSSSRVTPRHLYPCILVWPGFRRLLGGSCSSHNPLSQGLWSFDRSRYAFVWIISFALVVYLHFILLTYRVRFSFLVFLFDRLINFIVKVTIEKKNSRFAVSAVVIASYPLAYCYVAISSKISDVMIALLIRF